MARRLLAALAVTIILGACTTGTQAGGTSGAAAADAQSVSIIAPADGATVTVPFNVQLQSSGALGSPDTGDHHAHLYFDTGTDASDYDIVYGTTWQVTRSLAPGRHTITVALANPDHSLAGPTQQITVNVSGSGSGSGAGASPAPASPAPTTDPGYDY